MEIIVPAAGLSSRFPNTRPKYSLFSYSGEIMLKKALEPFLKKHRINIGILKKHDDEFNLKSLIENEIKEDINIVIIEKETLGPADTVFQILEKSNIPDTSEILIKDCDSFFDFDYSVGNFICVARLCDQEVINKPASKSYVISNDQGIVTKIIEK
jgi:bifunctional N-acetylglucosamine-1-phosphate-uridyltransferase/glucosamine-1-phosphate-acetyltransferase GlmU-like protein